MALAAVPTNFTVQVGNGVVCLQWDFMATATSYSVRRGTNPTDQTSFSVVATPAATAPNYTDSAVTVGAQYFYEVASVNGSGSSAYTTPVAAVPVLPGTMTLGQIRTEAQQRADMVSDNFVTTTEWNAYINQSLLELFDLLVTIFEDYYIAAPYTFTTTSSNTYPLPSDFYKCLGVDIGVSPNQQFAYATLTKFPFADRNCYVFGTSVTTPYGPTITRYRIMGGNIWFLPYPQLNQQGRIWYVPRLPTLLADTDIVDGVSGWLEYVIVDAVIKAWVKREFDPSPFILQKNALIKRINDSAPNRDAGMPEGVTDVQRLMGGPFGDGFGSDGWGGGGGMW